MKKIRFAASGLLASLCLPIISCSPTLGSSRIVVTSLFDSRYAPISKAKLGVARSTGFEYLPQTTQYIAKIGARSFCSQISFDKLTGSKKTNYALGTTKFLSGRVEVDDSSRSWVRSLLANLAESRQNVYLGLVGAPAPYQQPLIKKPAAHPTPTDILGAASSTSQWIDSVFPRSQGISWSIWNEPEHTLTGSLDLASARKMSEIYRVYAAAISNRNANDRFGLASFMKGSLKKNDSLGSNSYAYTVLDQLAKEGKANTDFISLNNYHGSSLELIDQLNQDLSRLSQDQPLVVMQFAPSAIGSNPSIANTVQSASLYLHALHEFNSEPSVSVVCMSMWAGIDVKALLRMTKPGVFSLSIPFNAIALYQSMPIWQVHVDFDQKRYPYSLWASHDTSGFQMIILPRLSTSLSDILPSPNDKYTRKTKRRLVRKAHRKGKTREEAKKNEKRQTYLPLVMKDFAGRHLTICRLIMSGQSCDQKRREVGPDGILDISIADNEIIIVKEDLEAHLNPLAPMLRNDLYIQREESGLAGWASVDQIRDGFIFSLPSPDHYSHASATYSSKSLDKKTYLEFYSPHGYQGILNALECTSLQIHEIQGGSHRVAYSVGARQGHELIQRSRVYSRSSSSLESSREWPALEKGSRYEVILPVNNIRSKTFRLHLASHGCATGTMFQARVTTLS